VSTPRFTVVAGANGCGKTTLTSDPDFFKKIPVLDPDAIGRTLQSAMPSTFPIASGRQVLQSAARHISRGESFAVETTLSGKTYLRMMLDARTRAVSKSYWSTLGRKMLRSTWLESEIGFWRVAMMSRRATPAGVTSEASRIFR
jgi:hypothetical protein